MADKIQTLAALALIAMPFWLPVLLGRALGLI